MTVHLQERNPVRINQGIRDAHMRLEGFKETFPMSSGGVVSWDDGDVTLTHATDALTIAGGQLTVTYGGTPVRTINTTDSAAVQALRIDGDRATPTANDQVYESIYHSDSAGTQVETGRITSLATSVTAGAVTSFLTFGVNNAGTMTNYMRVAPGVVSPNATDATALGSTSLMWSDLFLASGGVINFANSDVTITHGTDALTFAGGTIVAAAGTATVPPVKLQTGTNLTTAAAGAIEYDGKAFYATHAAGARGVLATEQFASQTISRTLSNTTAQQFIFDAANNTLYVQASTSYFFEALIHLSGMSATSGNFTFSLVGAGTATFTSCKWFATGFDSSTPGTTGASSASLSASATGSGDIVVAAAGTAVAVYITGIARIAAAGTLVPSVGLTTGIAATVEQNTFLRLRPVGANTTAAVGAWS